MSDEVSIRGQRGADSGDQPLAGSAQEGLPAPKPERWKERISRNLIALTVARGVTTVFTLLLTAYLTRTLEPQAYGILGFGTALLSYFLLFTRLGFDVVGVREVARAPERVIELTGTITGIQFILSVTAYVLYAMVVLLLPKSGLFKLVLLVQGLALFAQAISMEWVYQGVERMGVLAVRSVAIAVLHLAAVLFFVHSPEDVLLAAAAQVGALLLLNGWLVFTLVRNFGRFRLHWNLQAWRALLPSALPIAASTFMIGVFYNLDLVMLGVFRGEAEVGLYTASVRALTAVLIPAIVIAQAFFPALSHVHEQLPLMRERARRFAALMLPVGLPLATATALLAHPLIVLFAGDVYAPAASAFALLMVNAGVVYVNMTLGQPILAWNREKAYMAILGGGALLDVVLNLFLIPRYGIVGAASTTVLAQGMVGAGLAIVHIRLVHQAYLGLLARTAVATALGVVVPIVLLQRVDAPLLLILLAIAGSYSLAAWLFRLLPMATLRRLLARS
ncbi:MAG: flippase [Rhodothermaceae bacterium]|nr:flippase [Rhodothermaceae bacterium]